MARLGFPVLVPAHRVRHRITHGTKDIDGATVGTDRTHTVRGVRLLPVIEIAMKPAHCRGCRVEQLYVSNFTRGLCSACEADYEARKARAPRR